MTEKEGQYTVNKLDTSLDNLKGKQCLLPYSNNDYEPPEPEDVDCLIKAMGWSQGDTAKLTGVSYNPKKGSTTVRKWRAPKTSTESRAIPYAAWRLLLLHAQLVELDDSL